MPIGLGLGSVTGLVREARQTGGSPGPVRVYGARADDVVRALAAGSDEPRLVQAGGDATYAVAIVCLIDDEVDAAGLAPLRAGSRQGTALVAVRLDGTERPVPYVLATDVVAWAPGAPVPVPAIARRLAIRLRRDGRLLAARLPALRPAVHRELVSAAALGGAALVAVPWGDDVHLPILSMMQARMLLDLDVASGRPAPQSPNELALAVGPWLGMSNAVGLSARTVYRRVPQRLRRVAGPVLAYTSTCAIAAVGSRLPLPR